MQRISTTVIGLVGEGARACAEGLARAPNVRVELPDPAAPPLERAAAAWQAATSTQLPYLVHDADPLALVADAWVRWFDEQGPAGELEVAVRETVGRWRGQGDRAARLLPPAGPGVLDRDPAAPVPGPAVPGRPDQGRPRQDLTAHLACSTAQARA